MNLARTLRAFALVALLAASARADTLTFIASPDINGVINYSWFSTDNWYTNQPVTGTLAHVGRLPMPGDTAILMTAANAAGNGIRLEGLGLYGGRNVTVSGGSFVVANLQMSDDTAFNGSSIRVLSQFQGINYCRLIASTLSVNAGAFVNLSRAVPALFGAGLYLSGSTTIFNDGQIILTDGTELDGTLNGTDQCSLNNHSGATLSASGATWVSEINVANDGILRCDSGTLTFVDNIVWTNMTTALSKFKTTATNAAIQLGHLNVPAGVTFAFSGPGASRMTAGVPATILGTLQVGIMDPISQLIDVGTFESALDLNGTGVVHVVATNGSASTLILSGCTIAIPTITIDQGGQLNLPGTRGGVLLSGVTISNWGTTTWTGQGNALSFNQNAVFNNLAGALFDAQNDAALAGEGPPDGTFNNAGTFRKSAGTNDTFVSENYSPGVTFNNTGLLDVQTGGVRLMGGTNSGQFNVAANARLRFSSGCYTLAPGTTFTGAGSMALGGALLLVNTNVSAGNFTFDGSNGTLDGPASLTVTGTFNWSDGTAQGSGTINLASNASLMIAGGVTLNQRTLNNAGTVTVTGAISAGKGAVFNNLPGGLLSLSTKSAFDYDNNGAVPIFNNAGTLLVPVGFQPTVNWVFTNSGSLQVQGFSLSFPRGLTQIAGSTAVAAGATLTPGWTTPLMLQGGTLGGYGTIEGPVSNGATINLGATPGILQITGGYPKYYTQNSNGVLAIKIGGHTAGTQFDQLAVNGPLALDGTLAVSFINGFVPALGDSFPVVTFASSTGAFAAVTGNRAGNGLVLVPRNTGSSITLVVANDPLLSAPAEQGANLTFNVNTTSGFSYAVQYADTLAQPIQWHPLSTITGTGMSIPVTVPSGPGPTRFFRVSFQ